MATVKVEGIKNLNKALKDFNPDLVKRMKETNFETAEIVKSRAAKDAQMLDSQAAKASRSLRSSKAANQAAVFAGNKRYAFTIGTIFGAKRYKQFREYRKDSYWFFKSAEESKEQVQIFWTRMTQDLLDEVFGEIK